MRVKRGIASRKRHKKVLKLAEGFQGRKKNCFKLAKLSVQRALVYQYRDRKQRKRHFRTLWITRLNAAVREHGLSYSRFVLGLKKAEITLDRKILSSMAIDNPTAFTHVVQAAQAALA